MCEQLLAYSPPGFTVEFSHIPVSSNGFLFHFGFQSLESLKLLKHNSHSGLYHYTNTKSEVTPLVLGPIKLNQCLLIRHDEAKIKML